MTNNVPAPLGKVDQDRLLVALQRLLEIPATSLPEALTEAAQFLAEALRAEKFDAFLYDAAIDSLVAIGVSDTPLGHKQRALGLDRLPLTNGGRAVEVFASGVSFRDGDVEHDARELPGIRQGLGIRSSLTVALEVDGTRRGVLHATSTQPALFTERDQRFLEGVARWVGVVAHRGELAEQLVATAAEQSRRAAADELVTVLAHDLRNLLTPLKGRIDLIRRRAEREARVEDCHDAEELGHTVARLNRLIGDLLDVGRLDQGIFVIDPQPMDLVGLVQETVARFASADREIRVEAPDELVLVADPDRLRQALENVLANALHHSPEAAPVVVTIKQEQRSDGPWAVLGVQDQGPGIAPEVLPRLFTRFAAGPRSAGLGLGLYLAHSIAAAHGGTLTVVSAPGAGACFQFTFRIEARQLPKAPRDDAGLMTP
jgi:two-component system, OmpR family, sensor kinase